MTAGAQNGGLYREGQLAAGLTTFDWRRILGTFGNKPESTHGKKTAMADHVYLTRHSNEWPRAGGPVELSHAKGSVQEAASELGIDSIAPANRPDH